MPRPLIRQKLVPPRPWGGLIPRPRLEAALDAAIEAGSHVGLFAGGGYGKTALLAEWAQGRDVAWLTLDADDADLDAVLAYMIAAFEAAVPGFRTEATDLLGRAREREGAFAALAALLADLDEQVVRPVVLALDGWEQAASPSLDALLARLLRYMPPAVRVVVAARKPPEVDLAALRARDALRVLDEPALAFDRAELAALRPGEPDGAIDAALAETGGWPAAMGLTPELLDAFVEEQVLAKLPEPVLRFMRRAALVESFDARLCEEGLGEPFTRERRDLLLRERLILATGQDRYALHPAVRTYLARRFQADVGAAERTALLGRVALYLWNAEQPVAALRTWVEAGRGDEAAARLTAAADAWLAANRHEALAKALAVLGPAAGAPALRLVAAELRRRWGELDEAERLYMAVEAEAPAALGGKARLGRAQIAASRGDVAGARAALGEAPPVGDSPLAVDRGILDGGLALLSGDTAGAIAAYEGALAMARRLGDPGAEARATHNLGVCLIRTGDFAGALARYDRAAALTAADGTPLVWMAPVNRALVLDHLGRPDEAAAAAEGALALVRRYGLAREEGYALRILGFARLHQGREAEAEGCFVDAEAVARRTNDRLGLAYSLNFRAEAALARGDAAGAAGLAAEVERAMGGGEAAAGIMDFAQVRAKIALARGDMAGARALIDGVLAKARAQGYAFVAAQMARLADGVPEAPPPPAAPSAGGLRVRCLGGFQVEGPDGPVTDKAWQTTRARRLFAYLAMVPEGATKERLLEAVFPGEDVSNDLMNMTLMRLRKALEPDLEKGRPSRYLLRTEGRYRLNRQAPVTTDVEAFEALLRGARPGAPGERAALEAALAAYGGDLLPEIASPWVVAERLRLQGLALGAAGRLLALCDAEAPERSAGVLERALEIDPLSEEFNREVILRHLEAGDPQMARRHYEVCALRHRELADASPSADLAALVGY